MISIGTNFNYQGDYFLDGRQKVRYRSDLDSWTKVVPVGFEVYCDQDECWYLYIPTGDYKYRIGNFVPRWEYEYLNSDLPDELQKIDDRLKPLENYVYDRMKIVITDGGLGGGYYEIGDSTIPTIKWKLFNYLNEQVPISNTTVRYDGNYRYISGNISTFTPDIVLSDNLLFEVTSAAKETADEILRHAYGTIEFKFLPKSYLLTSYSDTLRDLSDAITILKERITDDMDLTCTVDCRGYEVEGGVYVHYLVPKLIVDSCDHFVQTVNDIPTSAIEINDLTLTNRFNIDVEYWDVRLQYKQNEVLNINFKYNK